MKIDGGLRVVGINRERTAAIDVHVDCEWEGGFSVAVAADALAPFVGPLTSISPVMDVRVAEKLTIVVPLDRNVVEVSLPADREEAPALRLPIPRFKGAFHGVFDETVKQLRRMRGSDSVRVRVRVEEGKMVVEPPRRVILLRRGLEGDRGQSSSEPVEVRILFRDLRQILRVFEAAELTPGTLWLCEQLLGIEAEYGRARVRGLIAAQPDY